MSIEKYIENWEKTFSIFDEKQYISVHKDFLMLKIRTSLEEYGREVRETPELPMGASNWLEHGIKYGYLEHFNLK